MITESRARHPKKIIYFDKLQRLCQECTRILIVQADHVGSRQMAEIRLQLRGKAVVLMGKNTMIRTAIKGLIATMPELENLISCIRDNVGLIFCKTELSDVRDIVLVNKVPAPARQGVVAPIHVVIPAGPTGLDPSQTSFFQALGVSTKIVKGQIEISSDVNLITAGDKVTPSQAALLQKLNIKPFSYGLKVLQVYDSGTVYESSVLDITNDDIVSKIKKGMSMVAAFSRETRMPNQVSIIHSLVHGFKNCAAAALETRFIFPEIEALNTVVS